MTAFIPMGIYGGTFDPIHIGHLRTALEMQQQLDLEQVRFVPCNNPVHRDPTIATAAQRLSMLQLALQDQKIFQVDTRELDRNTPSYMLLTLQSLADDFPQHSLCLALGLDAFITFDQWHRWQEIIDYAHLIIIERFPLTFSCIDQSPSLAQFIRGKTTTLKEDLQKKSGCIFLFRPTQLEISATQLRNMFAKRLSTNFLIPQQVIDYIEANALYAAHSQNSA